MGSAPQRSEALHTLRVTKLRKTHAFIPAGGLLFQAYQAKAKGSIPDIIKDAITINFVAHPTFPPLRTRPPHPRCEKRRAEAQRVRDLIRVLALDSSSSTRPKRGCSSCISASDIMRGASLHPPTEQSKTVENTTIRPPNSFEYLLALFPLTLLEQQHGSQSQLEL
jgi:hypothetical protein